MFQAWKRNGAWFPERPLRFRMVVAYLPTTNTQLVVPLPPMFSIAKVFASST
jgi:hypothetical protein